MTDIFFSGWFGIIRILIIAVCSYLLLILLLRASGKRTLGQMNAFDFIITIALGSTLSSTIIDENVSLANGMTALGILVLMQFAITWLSVRFETIDRLVKATPATLVRDGVPNRDAMKYERVTEEEVRAALREGHWDRLEDVRSVVLETNGKLTVIYKDRTP